MRIPFRSSLPILLALMLVSFISYRIFSVYKPAVISEKKVQGTSVVREEGYLSSVPLPLSSKIVGENYSEKFEQVTATVEKSPDYIFKFYKNVLVSKGWDIKTENTDTGGEVTYRREAQDFSVSVLSYDSKETVFSLTYEK